MIQMKLPIVLIALFALLPQTGYPAYGVTVFENPIQISEYNLPFTKVGINGRECLALIDSGSFRGIQLSSNLARELNLPLIQTSIVAKRYQGKELYVQASRIQRLTIGNYGRQHLDVEVIQEDIESISNQVGTKFDVILGWGLLSQFYLALDYRNKVIRLSDAPLTNNQKKLSLSYSVVNRVPVVEGSIDSQKVRLLFDTGAPMCNIDPGLAGESRMGEKVSKEVSLGDQILPVAFRVKDLTVIKKSLNCVGVIGNNFLSKYSVYFDIKGLRITLD